MQFLLKFLSQFFTVVFFYRSLGGSGARICEGQQSGYMCPALEGVHV